MNLWEKLSHQPAIIITLSFLLIIITGSILLTLPFSSKNGSSVPYIDAYFTANSATCVTGLVVRDTADTYSFFGQAIILLLIQLGGLGYMTVSTFLAILLRRKVFITHRLIVKEALSSYTIQGTVSLIRNVFFIVFTVEAIGALILFLRFLPVRGWKWALWGGIFHSVSAFCNAGFDIMGGFNSFTAYAGDWVVSMTLALLIIIGGIGFIVISEVLDYKMNKRFTTHTKLVLLVTALLIVFGTIAILLAEYNNPSTIGPLPLHAKILSSFFQSVTPRTAGFNTVSMPGLTTMSLFLITFLMFVGASPGGTGGGIKTTTFGVIISTVISVIRGKHEVEMFRRRISNEHILKAMTITILSLGVVFAAVALVSYFQNLPLRDVIFEVVSAFGTVGLSVGITPFLCDASKIVIISTMFIGRVGTLNLFMALTLFKIDRKIRLPKTDISIG
ncbi:MAG: TrkH family potassium uptake protein [bacterium]